MQMQDQSSEEKKIVNVRLSGILPKCYTLDGRIF